MRRTKIVCTLGPAVDDPSVLADLVSSGLDVARINFSHGTHADHGRRIAAVRAAAAAVGRPVAVLQDLCGPKIRIGEVAAGRVLRTGEPVVFCLGEVREPSWVPLPVPEIFRSACPGDRMLLDDGLIEVVVESGADDVLECRVVTGGPLGSRKGICLPGVTLAIDALTAKDREDAAFGRAVGVDYVAVSFVRSAADLEMARTVVGPGVPLLAKIEKSEAVARIDSILQAADGV
ncbi:MAG: pyruvate kinase, partial [Armatimonadaceae bacterium]